MKKVFQVLSVVTLLGLGLGQMIGCARPSPTPSPTVAVAATPSPIPEASPTPVPQATAPPAVAEFVGLVYNLPINLEPAIGADIATQEFYIGAYESLIANRPGTLDLEPSLAESWEVSEGGVVYTFKLREGVKFHDGKTLDAEDVKVSFERMKEIGLGYAWVLGDLKEVRIVDPLTVEIVLNEPSAVFLDAVPLVLIVSAEAVQEHEKDGDLAQEWLIEHEAGTGPYMLESWTLGQEMILTKFDDYWGGWEGKHLDRVILQLVQESGTQAVIMEAGEANWADTLIVEDAEELGKDPRFSVEWHPSLSLFWSMMDTNRPPLDDVRVREAIRYAFDYTAMGEDIWRGHAQIPSGYLLPAFAEHDPSIPKEHQDLAKAKELLAQAGYPNGGFTLDVLYMVLWEWERKACELLQSNLAELGIDVEITGEVWATFVEKVTDPDRRPAMAIFTAGPKTSSPDSTLYQTWCSESTHWSNYGYSNPEVDRLVKAARTELDDAKRTELYREVQRVLQEDSPAINTVITENPMVLTANIRGFIPLPMWPTLVDYYLLYFD